MLSSSKRWRSCRAMNGNIRWNASGFLSRILRMVDSFAPLRRAQAHVLHRQWHCLIRRGQVSRLSVLRNAESSAVVWIRTSRSSEKFRQKMQWSV